MTGTILSTSFGSYCFITIPSIGDPQLKNTLKIYYIPPKKISSYNTIIDTRLTSRIFNDVIQSHDCNDVITNNTRTRQNSRKIYSSHVNFMSFLLGNHGAHMLNGNTVQIFNILYWNINGMKLEKLEKIEKYLQKHQTTILCVAETWFIQDETYKKHKFFHTESIKGNKDHQGRFSGGLSIFAHNNIQDKIHILEQHTLHLTIRIETKIMTFIYFKPSLESIFINDHLNNHISHKPNILMGDFNANFFTGEKLDRQEAILQYCQPNRLELKSFNSRVIIKSQTDSEDTKNNCDFIFASNDVIHNTITYTQPKNFNINSDHGLLTINQVHFPKRFQNITQENTPTHTSYNVWKFQKDNQIATKFRQYYENYTKNKFTELKQKHSQLIPIENRQEIINDLTKFIENSIHNTCKTILGQKHYRKSKLILL